MAGRLLSFANYIGSQDNVQVIEMTPSVQKTFTYDFNADVSAYTFEADMQTIVVDTLSYDTATGNPNFTTSSLTGSFANAEIGSAKITNAQAATGIIKFTIPSQRYTGNIIPDARANVPITVVSFRWTDTSVTPNVTENHRWAILERYEPDVVIGDPTLDSGYTAIPTS